jgi:hypothetical protein
MRAPRSFPPSRAAAASPTGGCLATFWLPPLSVVIVGLMLSCLLFQAGGNLVVLDVAARELSRDLATSTASASGSTLAPLFTPEVHSWANHRQDWAAQVNLDVNLVATVMQVESCGDPLARSPAGAMGLFQVMPYHFDHAEDPYDPDTNARRALAYLQRTLQLGAGDPSLAFAAYNGGPGVIGQSESLWPAETRRYVYWASGIYADARRGLRASPRLQEWLEAGGAGLCRQARQRLGLGE